MISSRGSSMKNTILVKYIREDSDIFKMGGMYEVINPGHDDCYVVKDGALTGFLICKTNAIEVDLPDELFKWESEG